MKLQDIAAEEMKVETVRGDLDSQKNNLERTKSAYESSGLDERIKQQEQERLQIESQINSLNEEMAASGAQAETRARLSLLQSERTDKQAQVDRLITSLSGQFEALAKRPLGSGDQIQQNVDSLIRSQQDAVRKAEDKYQEVNVRMQTADAKLSMARDDFAKQQGRFQGI
jgi:phosphoglycerol transferase MdoB-like AlkP superfamily enzyme